MTRHDIPWLSAAETAAWRLKFLAIPISVLVLWFGRKLYRSIAASPDRFCGGRYARRGLIASAAVPLLILVLIGVTVPERLRARRLGIEAGLNAQAYRIDRALDEYREKFGSLPDNMSDLSRRLPDADHTLAAALGLAHPQLLQSMYIFKQPKIVNADLRVSRRFSLRENMKLELLAEGFNIFNRTQVSGVNTSIYTASVTGTAPNQKAILTFNPTFGTVNEAGATLFRERQIQFAARFEF